MAKGKHAPSKGAIRKDKVLHPESRKVKRLQAKEHRRVKLESVAGRKTGSQRLIALGEKLLWFQDNLIIIKEAATNESEEFKVTPDIFLKLISEYLSRFDDEKEQIELKNNLSKNRKFQHSSRLDAIALTLQTENDDFNGCGLEVPDLLNKENLDYFINWNGELRFVQNIKLERYSRKSLETRDDSVMME